MHAFLLEQLFPTGWRKTGELFWRFTDAHSESLRLLRDQSARGVRVFEVKIEPEPIIEMLQVSNVGDML